ncbi:MULTISPECIES: NAD-dependent succinate-semialdehyde dehydrogenase [Pseudomonas]|uniref:NAD-dependent succinate-semialdehyde dehydrogenase n=1 Tax=Pseudomonas TaxID=286 RepID=UPI000CFFCE46|nr:MULTISPECIES: NAD-dependent succinate-semialdehyde dehydrogenase [Pseudomonas]PRA53697.1 NAD-dependent succinate-semialdehyde dehydrogenase [Pseudomonas sp. MYb115]QXN48107.1 NAD-dependent succinate-semialdehyde dehydrogenase [Pseudomonas fluorescens]WSO22417.1 NAD-dependent succinate-semialdehyde dehydrogenase [Pseudomonas fluorescens]
MRVIESLLIDGQWSAGNHPRRADVFNPANGEVIAQLSLASSADLDRALAAAARGFEVWRKTSAYERSKVLRRAADLVRERADEIAALITLEQGKPLAEARMEAFGAGDHIDWYAEEGRRAYGRVIPARASGVRQMVLREPIGPVAAFSPWNFPVSQLVRKIAGALAAGCSIIAKGPEETPSSCIELCRAFQDAGVPAGVLNLVFGVPAEVSDQLIRSEIIRKVSFTGSVPVGRALGALAGQYLKRCTLELGGHAPFIVCDDVDVDAVATLGANLKFRNGGQICVSPTRFYVQASVYERFVETFCRVSASLKLGDGQDASTQLGPLANPRRVTAAQEYVDDALAVGAQLRLGGQGGEGAGFYYPATVLTEVPENARIMSEEPFAPIASIVAFDTLEAVIAKANGLPFGLAAFAFTRSVQRATLLADELQSGMVSINHFGLAAPETPFGGVKDSGYGSEGGSEGLDAYFTTKFVSQVG